MEKNENYWNEKIELVDSSEFKDNPNAKTINNIKNKIKKIKNLKIKIIVFFILIIGFYFSIKLNFGRIYFILIGFLFIFFNLDDKDANKNILKKGMNKIGLNFFNNNEEENEIISDPKILYEKAFEYQNKLSKYGNKKCYCGSQLKYKKCCRPWDNNLGIKRHLKDNEGN